MVCSNKNYVSTGKITTDLYRSVQNIYLLNCYDKSFLFKDLLEEPYSLLPDNVLARYICWTRSD